MALHRRLQNHEYTGDEEPRVQRARASIQFRSPGSEFRVWGVRFRVSGFWFLVSSFRVLGSGFWCGV